MIPPGIALGVKFQSTLPRRERLPFSRIFPAGAVFQSTLPRRERRCIQICFPKLNRFNPRSHEGSDGCKVQSTEERQYVSIHAPTKGATTSPTSLFVPIKCFNPRSHEGSDLTGMRQAIQQFCFNPRSHEGSDIRDSLKEYGSLCFNPRSHEGSDFPGAWPQYRHNCFNPRSHEGSDPSQSAKTRNDPVSIHAPTKGATRKIIYYAYCKMFQSTLPRRERPTGFYPYY